MLAHQNCSQIQAGLNVTDSAQSISAIIEDNNGNVIDVIRDVPKDDSDIVKEPAVETPVPAEVNPTPSPQNQAEDDANSDDDDENHDQAQAPHEDSDDDQNEDQNSTECNEMARKYKKQAMDIAGIEHSSKLIVLKGKNFIYSSKGSAEIAEVEINDTCGRVIICGVHIHKVKSARGRVDLVQNARVDSFEDHRGNLNQ